MTCKKIGVNNRVTNLCVMNCVCVCVYGTVCYMTLVFLKAAEKYERSVIHIKIVRFMLMHIIFVTTQCIWCLHFFALRVF